MHLQRLLHLTVLFLTLVNALPHTTPTTLLRYTPSPLPHLLRTIVKDPLGALHLGSDGILRSFAANASVIDYRHLSASQTHGLAPDGRGILSEDEIMHPRLRPGTLPADADPGVLIGAEIMAECTPPLACWNSTSCSGGCGACTYLGFFPYGLCLSG